MNDSRSQDVSSHVNRDGIHSLQITNINGFFNRKRGRPPKNRFVEVYKNVHHSPQAIFTSFKLEKHEPALNIVGSESCDNRLTQRTVTAYCRPNRARNQKRNWFKDLTTDRPSMVLGKPLLCDRTSSFVDFNLDTSQAQTPSITTKSIKDDISTTSISVFRQTYGNVSVVRAAGTFYPEQAPSSNTLAVNDASLTTESLNECLDQPEDLTVRSTSTTKVDEAPIVADAMQNEPIASLHLLQIKQLLDLYQKQIIIPSFLRSLLPTLASQVATVSALDTGVRLQNDDQQELLLINVGASSADHVPRPKEYGGTTTCASDTSIVPTDYHNSLPAESSFGTKDIPTVHPNHFATITQIESKIPKIKQLLRNVQKSNSSTMGISTKKSTDMLQST